MNESRMNRMRRAGRPVVIAGGLIVILAVVTWAARSIVATCRLIAALGDDDPTGARVNSGI